MEFTYFNLLDLPVIKIINCYDDSDVEYIQRESYFLNSFSSKSLSFKEIDSAIINQNYGEIFFKK